MFTANIVINRGEMNDNSAEARKIKTQSPSRENNSARFSGLLHRVSPRRVKVPHPDLRTLTNIYNRGRMVRKNAVRFMLNDLIAKFINVSYNSYSRFYEGQLRIGLPVSKELIQSREEIRSIAAGKLALTLYHIFLGITGIRIPRHKIKNLLLAELEAGTIRLTENVIILNKKQLKEMSLSRMKIPAYFYSGIYEEATRRRILKETLKQSRVPAYFDSEIEESIQNGRGDYETVYYQDYTEEGKDIKFRRLVSIEDVTAGDNRPSVIMLPGFANNSNCFDLSNQQSFAKDLADNGCWTYLFDPRGMGINKGKFDPMYTVDTLIDYDLPTVLHFIFQRSGHKPSILMGHSMGGIIAENMVLTWNLRRHLNSLTSLTPEQKAHLNRKLPSSAKADKYLKEVRGIITFGAPKFFKKLSHAFFPAVLWLNHLSRMLRLRQVPVKDSLEFIMQFPIVSDLIHYLAFSNVADLNVLMCPENQKFSKEFTNLYIERVIESVPLGLGFQFLKAIYNGEGFKRMDETRLNYTAHVDCFPEDIPVFHFWGSKDPLAPADNLNFSKHYPHRVKRVYHIENGHDAERINITDERSQLVDIVVEGANHLDLLYGRLAEEIVKPMTSRIIEKIWGDWSYNSGE
ncbi:MAG: alpha/beta hydrolase [Deltaproteobacteria bacterium]|nr:alpha/beta hydrolase [Deltaproteobacteria bacterium]